MRTVELRGGLLRVDEENLPRIRRGLEEPHLVRLRAGRDCGVRRLAASKQRKVPGRGVVDRVGEPRNKKSWRRPTLARPGDALPSAMEPLTSVFGMGTGMTTPLWSPAKTVSWTLKRIATYRK